MAKRQRLALMLIVLAIAAAVMVWALRKSPVQTIADAVPTENAIATSSDGAAAPSPAQTIEFSNSIVIADHSISVDGAAWSELACAENGEITIVGKVTLFPGKAAQLLCMNEYMGGVWLEVSGVKFPIEKWGLKFGDAGETLDARTWLSRAADGILVEQVTLSSVRSGEGAGNEVSCTNRVQAFLLKPDLTIDEQKVEYSKERHKFDPPPQIEEKCRGV